MPNNNKKSRSDARKQKAQRSWARAQERKQADIAENERRRKINASLRAQGQETPYQKSQRERRERRTASRSE